MRAAELKASFLTHTKGIHVWQRNVSVVSTYTHTHKLYLVLRMTSVKLYNFSNSGMFLVYYSRAEEFSRIILPTHSNGGNSGHVNSSRTWV